MRLCLIILLLPFAAFLFTGCGEETTDDSGIGAARTDTPATHATPGRTRSGVADQRDRLPRMVDLGKGECVPCKMMAPILTELAEEYRGRAIVEIIDIGDKPEAVKQYGMRVMPTQVFFDIEGNEVWRHEGFLPRETIIERLKEMGVEPPDG